MREQQWGKCVDKFLWMPQISLLHSFDKWMDCCNYSQGETDCFGDCNTKTWMLRTHPKNSSSISFVLADKSNTASTLFTLTGDAV